ncbi:MAG: DNA repair protein RadC [Alphaproteobacteria bacterium]
MADDQVEAPPDYLGHRARLKQRFLKSGADALADYELIELLLFLAVPRRDVRPLAKALLKRLGSFAAVVNAPPGRIKEIDGLGDSAVIALRTAHAAAVHLLRSELKGRPVLGAWNKVIDYLEADMAWRTEEHVRVLYMNQKNVLIADELMHQGTVNQAAVYPREIAKRALELRATAAILVHNHPSGDSTPSATDVDLTRAVRDALKAVGVALHDHIVVARDGTASLRDLGKL